MSKVKDEAGENKGATSSQVKAINNLYDEVKRRSWMGL